MQEAVPEMKTLCLRTGQRTRGAGCLLPVHSSVAGADRTSTRVELLGEPIGRDNLLQPLEPIPD